MIRMPELTGYKRKDGRFGIRNHLLVMPTICCANVIGEELYRIYGDDIVFVTHPYGCTFDTVNNDEVRDTIASFASNPNVGAILLVGLGCETVDTKEIFKRVRDKNDLSELLIIQDSGGTKNTIEAAKPIIDRFIKELNNMVREPMEVSDLIVGTQCGASDSYSGLTANPALGLTIDKVVDNNGTGVLTELTEFVGAEQELYDRCVNDEVRKKLEGYMEETERNLARVGSSDELRDIAPGNIAGGLTTLEEKSLGCIKKGGSRPIVEVVFHGEAPTQKGLVVMEGPGHDIESLVALAATGTQVTFFTTGRGSPVGSAIMPVIKISSNSDIAVRLKDNIDINAGTILDDKETLEEVANRMYQELMDVSNGKRTKSEENRHREFAIRRRGKDVVIL